MFNRLRILIKRLLPKYKHPAEGQKEAVTRVLQQAEAPADERSKEWAVNETSRGIYRGLLA